MVLGYSGNCLKKYFLMYLRIFWLSLPDFWSNLIVNSYIKNRKNKKCSKWCNIIVWYVRIDVVDHLIHSQRLVPCPEHLYVHIWVKIQLNNPCAYPVTHSDRPQTSSIAPITHKESIQHTYRALRTICIVFGPNAFAHDPRQVRVRVRVMGVRVRDCLQCSSRHSIGLLHVRPEAYEPPDSPTAT